MCVRWYVNPWENGRSFVALAARGNGFIPRRRDLVDAGKAEEKSDVIEAMKKLSELEVAQAGGVAEMNGYRREMGCGH